MTDPLRLLIVFSHPDDESMGMGGTLAKYTAEGVEAIAPAFHAGREAEKDLFEGVRQLAY